MNYSKMLGFIWNNWKQTFNAIGLPIHSVILREAAAFDGKFAKLESSTSHGHLERRME